MSVLRFSQITKPIIYSRIIRSKVEKQNNKRVVFVFFMIILNISVERTEFIFNGGSISRRNLTIAPFIGIYDSKQYKVIHPSSDLHVIWHSKNLKNYLNTDSRLKEGMSVCLAFSIENCLLQRCLFSISTLSNNGVIHGVPLVLQMSLTPKPNDKCELKFSAFIHLKAYSFMLSLLYQPKFSAMNLTKYSCAGFVSPWWYKQRACLNKWRHFSGK